LLGVILVIAGSWTRDNRTQVEVPAGDSAAAGATAVRADDRNLD